MEDRDLAFMLERSPVLENLIIMESQIGVRVRLVSHSLRCLQVGFTFLEDIVVVDGPRLERLLQWTTFGHRTSRNKFRRSSIKIGPAPNLRVLGYLDPGENELDITNTVIVVGIKENIVLSVQTMALEVQFGVRNAVNKVPGFLRCFPNLETLHIQSRKADEPTGKVNLKFWQEGGPIKCVVQAMKKVFLYEFPGSRTEVAFLKFIAERARVLEKMVIVVANEGFSSGDEVNAKLKPLTCAKWTSEACNFKSSRAHSLEGELQFIATN